MSRYATLDELLRHARGGRADDLAEGDLFAGITDEGVLIQALDDASALIDSYLSRYQIDEAAVPAVLRRICLVIAFHQLHIEIVPDKVQSDYDAAIKWLESVAKGVISLPLPETGQPAPAAPKVRLVEGRDQRFSNDALKGL